MDNTCVQVMPEPESAEDDDELTFTFEGSSALSVAYASSSDLLAQQQALEEKVTQDKLQDESNKHVEQWLDVCPYHIASTYRYTRLYLYLPLISLL